jgi:hypothetical protein
MPDPERKAIRFHLDESMRKKKLFVEIFSISRNLIFEGACAISCCDDGVERTYTLANSDSNFTMPIGTIKLSDVGWLCTL